MTLFIIYSDMRLQIDSHNVQNSYALSKIILHPVTVVHLEWAIMIFEAFLNPNSKAFFDERAIQYKIHGGMNLCS